MRHVWGRSVGVGAVTDIGVRDPPSWVVRRRYEWSWLYAAIEPDTGGDLCRYLSALDGVCFEVSLQHLGERFCGEVIGSVLDNQDFEAVVKLASVTELLIGEGQQTPVSIAFFTYSCA